MSAAPVIDLPHVPTHAANDSQNATPSVIAFPRRLRAYDMADQPRAISGLSTGTYQYDGNMKRVKSVVDGVTIYNIYDASGSLVHIDDLGTGNKTDYVKGAGLSLARIKKAGPVDITRYLHPDHLGSPVVGTNSSGNLAWIERYTPFGEEINDHPVNDNQAGFTGHIKDSATGLSYMQARYYDPVIGRFLSIDPVTFMDTGNPGYFNRYAYTMNDPINLIDPDGRQSSSPGNQGGCSGYGNGCTGVRNSDGTYSFVPDRTIPAGNVQGMSNVVGALTLGMGGVGKSGSSALGQGLNRGSRALQSTAKPLVLGLDKAGLTGFAEKIGGTHLMKSQNPGLDFLAAVSDKSQKFVVRLDGLQGSTPKEMFNNATSRGAMSDALGQMGKGGNRTNWELHKLKDAGRLADTTFTLGDDIVKID
ncbi:MAG: RHS repeat-associated core domain-containing protein [Alphaproteobacteria bacterium]